MTRRTAALLATFMCLVAAPAAAQDVSVVSILSGNGQQPISTTNVNASFSGSLVIAFHGDPAGGCAAVGLCGYSGVIVWRPSGGPGNPSGTLLIEKFRSHRTTSFSAGLILFDGSPASTGTVVVHRAVPGRGPATCGDVIGGSAFIPLTVVEGRVGIQLVGGGNSLFASHCAGPLDEDLAAALPAAVVPLRTVRAGHHPVDLSGTHDFAAGGLAGTVHSTLTLHLGARELSSPNPRPPRRVRRPRFRIVTVPLKLVALTGTLSQSISGVTSTDVCAVLDSCGLHGATTVAPSASSGTGALTVVGPARRPYRDFLAALGLSASGRTRGLEAFGSLDVGGGGTLTTSIVQGSTTCHASSPLAPGLVELLPTASGVGVLYAPLESLKGRCPGPLVDSPNGALASGTVARRAIAHGRVTISLHGSGGFSDDGYTGRTSGSLRLTLTFGRPHQHLLTGP